MKCGQQVVDGVDMHSGGAKGEMEAYRLGGEKERVKIKVKERTVQVARTAGGEGGRGWIERKTKVKRTNKTSEAETNQRWRGR